MYKCLMTLAFSLGRTTSNFKVPKVWVFKIPILDSHHSYIGFWISHSFVNDLHVTPSINVEIVCWYVVLFHRGILNNKFEMDVREPNLMPTLTYLIWQAFGTIVSIAKQDSYLLPIVATVQRTYDCCGYI